MHILVNYCWEKSIYGLKIQYNVSDGDPVFSLIGNKRTDAYFNSYAKITGFQTKNSYLNMYMVGFLMRPIYIIEKGAWEFICARMKLKENHLPQLYVWGKFLKQQKLKNDSLASCLPSAINFLTVWMPDAYLVAISLF